MNVPARVAEGPAVRSAEEWREIVEDFEREGAVAFVSLGPAPADAAARDAGLDLGGGMVLRLRRRNCRPMFRRAASGCRRVPPTCASPSTASPRLCATISAAT
ncbi:MAG: hypothetical protein OXI01_03780 [Albidovulum sp.]|nr:hypothetical protein [Albidovulum sp.]